MSQSCIELLRQMNECGVINRFMLICVDDIENIPKGITTVPTLIIVGIPKLLVGPEAMQWLLNHRQIIIQQNATLQGKIHLHNMVKNDDGLKGFSSELNGMSDDFAYTDVDCPQPKSFCGPSDQGDIIMTPPVDTKLNQSNQKKLINNLKNIRDQQETQTKENMKHDQIAKYMHKEQEQLWKTHMGL